MQPVEAQGKNEMSRLTERLSAMSGRLRAAVRNLGGDAAGTAGARRISLPAAVAALVGAALIGGTLIGSVLAQPRSAAGTDPAPPRIGGAGLGENAQQYCNVFLDTFAQRLGVERSALVPAGRAAANAAVDAAVRAGDVSQEQATRIKERIASFNGNICTLAPMWKRGGERDLGGLMTALADAAAGAIKLERGALVERLRDGESLREIAQKQQVDYAAVTRAVTEAARQRLDQAVRENRMTRERADQLLDRLNDWLADGGELSRAGFRGFGPGRPPFGGGPPFDND